MCASPGHGFATVGLVGAQLVGGETFACLTPHEESGRVVTIEEVRSFAIGLPRTTEALVHSRVKFRVGRIVYAALSRDGTVLGFAFPRELRAGLVDSQPEKFMMPRQSDLRYNWVLVRLDSINASEMRELVLDAWQMVVPKRVSAAYDELHGHA